MRRFLSVFLVVALALSASLCWAQTGKSDKEKEKQSKESVKIEDLIAKGEYQKAIDLANKFIAAKQVTEGLYIDLGVAHFSLKQYPDALAAFEKAAELNPFGIKALEYEATCYHEMNQEDKVADTYQKILAIDPTQDEVRYNLGHLYEKMGKMPEAMQQYDQLVSTNPGFKDVACDVGVMLLQKGELDKAEPYLQKAVAAKPDEDTPKLALAQLYLKQEKYDKAIPILQDYVKVTKSDLYKPAVLHNIAVSQMKLKKYDDAVATYDQILALRPNEERALLGKAQCYLELKDYAKATPILENYMKVSQDEAKKKEVAKLLKEIKGKK